MRKTTAQSLSIRAELYQQLSTALIKPARLVRRLSVSLPLYLKRQHLCKARLLSSLQSVRLIKALSV
jgi:hypothetical protein